MKDLEFKGRDMEKTRRLRLCYISGPWAYFTDQFDNQWGDDWNDAPYQHNAGLPYDHVYINGKEAPAHIELLAFIGPFDAPCDSQNYWSAEDINSGKVAWLSPNTSDHSIHIWAGASIEDFTSLVLAANGRVFLEQP